MCGERSEPHSMCGERSEPHSRVASVASHLLCILFHAHARGRVGGGRGRELQQPWQPWAATPLGWPPKAGMAALLRSAALAGVP